MPERFPLGATQMRSSQANGIRPAANSLPSAPEQCHARRSKSDDREYAEAEGPYDVGAQAGNAFGRPAHPLRPARCRLVHYLPTVGTFEVPQPDRVCDLPDPLAQQELNTHHGDHKGQKPGHYPCRTTRARTERDGHQECLCGQRETWSLP